MLASLLLTLALAQDVGKPSAGPVLKLPAQIQAQPGQPFAVIAESNLKWVRWKIPPGLTRVPPELTSCGERGYVGYGPAGVYEFKIEGTYQDQYAEATCVVFVGQPAPPGPRPPEPPSPADPFVDELRKLYQADASPKKAEQLETLIAIYSTAASGALRDPAVTTTGQLFAKLRAVSQLMLPEDALRGVRERLAAECRQHFSTDVPLTDELRKRACTCFERIAGALASIR